MRSSSKVPRERRGSIEDGINYFHRMSVHSLFDGSERPVSDPGDGNDRPRTSSASSPPIIFKEKSIFNSISELERSSASSVGNSRSIASSVIPSKGVVSISTVFVGVFLLFVTILGVSLMSISAKYAMDSSALSSDGTAAIQKIYSDLVNRTNARLINSSGYSVNALTDLVSQQINQRVASAVINFTSTCKFVVAQMADMTEMGELEVTDIDYTVMKMWRLQREFPTVYDIMFSGAIGTWIILYDSLRSVPFRLSVMNPPGTVCRSCSPGLNTSLYSYSVNNASNLMQWTMNHTLSTLRPTQRPWYKTGLQGKGQGIWTAPYVFVGSSNVIGITATRMTKDKNGKTIGVVGSDLTMSQMSTFLKDLCSEVDIQVREGNSSLRSGGFQLAIVHESGTLLATSTEAPLSRNSRPLNWSQALDDESILRTAFVVVDESTKGNWSTLIDDQNLHNFRNYPHDKLLIMTKPYTDDWGLRIILISVVPVAEYRQTIDSDMMLTLQEIKLEHDTALQIISEVKGNVDANLRRNWTVQLATSIATLFVGSTIVFAFAMRISHTLRNMAVEMERVAMLDFSDRNMYRAKYVEEVVAIGNSFKIMDMNLLSFSRYVPENVVRLLSKNGTVAHLGVAPRSVSIMFSDIVGFTTIAEELSPESLITVLAEYLEVMSDCIEDSGGTVGKYIGDAIMAFWNSPTKLDDHANVACACALQQLKKLQQLQEKWRAQGYPPICMRLGLSTGKVLHGNVGSSKRMEWTLIGDEVNLASRLEAMGKQYGVTILISGNMHELVKDQFLARPIDRVVAVGKKRSVDVYELVEARESATPEQARYCSEFEAVVEAYRSRDFALARQRATAYAEAFGNDTTARKYVERCDHFMAHPPAADWDGTFVLTSK